MSSIVNCPSCNRKLRVPDELLGKLVKCPTCDKTFTAAAEMVRPEPPASPPEIKEAPPLAAELESPAPKRAPRLRNDEDEAAFASEEYEEEGRPRRRRRRPDMQPHRGTLILVLGILGFVFCGFLGPVAWIMGNNDLREMRAGRMDPEGEGTTQAGRIIGMITTILMVLTFCGGMLLFAFIFMGRAAHRGF